MLTRTRGISDESFEDSVRDAVNDIALVIGTGEHSEFLGKSVPEIAYYLRSIVRFSLVDAPPVGNVKARHMKMLEALRQGLLEGRITVDSKKDVDIIFGILDKGLWRMSSLVEHYAGTGELLDAVAMANDNGPVRRKQTITRLQALYDYNMASSEGTGMPLEIRMNFAGCFDEKGVI